MKATVPWPLTDVPGAALPAEVELVCWGGGVPTPAVLDAEFVVMPAAAEAVDQLVNFVRLRVVQAQSAGVDWLLPSLPGGVLLCDARGMHDVATAEWVMAAILACQREFPRFMRMQSSARWRPRRTQELAGRRALILGIGSVGRAVEKRLSAFDVHITKVGRNARQGVHAWEEIPQLLATSDIVIISLPLTAHTRGLVDQVFLSRLPDGALLVNAGRGPVVDTRALVVELTSGRIRAALDVTDPEPLPSDHPLWSAPNLLITPHVAGNTLEARTRVQRLAQAQIVRYAAGQRLLNQVT